jgi:heparin binding hemagglutinin HbhA
MPTLTKSTVTPLYAIAGAGDLAVEKIREAGDDLTARVVALREQPKSVQTELTKRQAELTKQFEKRQAEFAKRFETLSADAKTVPAQLRELPASVQARLTVVVGQAEATYDELAGRGKSLVTRIRKQSATEDATAQAKTTVRKAKATKTSARKAADNATRNAKATTTSAKKTASSAAKATGAAASKVGD